MTEVLSGSFPSEIDSVVDHDERCPCGSIGHNRPSQSCNSGMADLLSKRSSIKGTVSKSSEVVFRRMSGVSHSC